MTRKERISYSKDRSEILSKGLAICINRCRHRGAIHNWIPQSFIENVVGGNNPFAVMLATVVGIPMYADIFGTLPIAESVICKRSGRSV